MFNFNSSQVVAPKEVSAVEDTRKISEESYKSNDSQNQGKFSFQIKITLCDY